MIDKRNWLRGPACAAALFAGPAFGMGQGLKVCLESGPPPVSSEARGGIDLAVARQVADWLGRPLEIVWYEVEDDADASPRRRSTACCRPACVSWRAAIRWSATACACH